MTKTSMIPIIVLSFGVLLINGIREQYDMAPREPMSAIPAQLSNAIGIDVPIDTAEQRVAGMSQFMLRSYGSDSTPLFTTYVGYYNRQVQGRSIHSPKNCLPGAGWEIRETGRLPFDALSMKGSVNRVLLSNRGANALVYYWYQGRGRIEASEYLVKWNLLRDAAVFGRTEETLVRIVVPLPAPSGSRSKTQITASADSLALRVAGQLVREVQRVLPAGPSGTERSSQ